MADTATLGSPTTLEENGPIYTNHKLLRLNEMKEDSPAAIKELNSSLKALEEDTDGFNWRIQQTFTGFLLTFCSLFQKTGKEEILLCSLQEASVTLIPKPCRVQERMLKANSSQELRCRNSQQSASRSSKNDLNNIQYDQITTIYPSYTLINQYNRLKKTIHIASLSINAKKEFNEIQHLFRIKSGSPSWTVRVHKGK